MIKFKLDFNKIIGYFINRGNRFFARKAERDWRIMFVCFLAILIVVLVTSEFLFWKIQTELLLKDDLDIGKEGDQTLVIKKDLLKSILDEIEKKKEKYNEVLTIPPSIQDPSL
ncbi:hypothetical protein KJ750_00540 [Patescibacteria group bacterium]|nr:hypothetical protein [Patescibacteria group bacterium]MBU2263134.1 hypothetical protein [Patescibacteria group bacterium]